MLVYFSWVLSFKTSAYMYSNSGMMPRTNVNEIYWDKIFMKVIITKICEKRTRKFPNLQ